MSSFPNFTEKWNREVKPFAEQVVKECKTDPWVAQYVSAMIWDINLDLREERLPIYRLFPCVRKLNNTFYYSDVHKLTDPKEVEKLKKLGRMLEDLQGAARTK